MRPRPRWVSLISEEEKTGSKQEQNLSPNLTVNHTCNTRHNLNHNFTEPKPKPNPNVRLTLNTTSILISNPNPTEPMPITATLTQPLFASFSPFIASYTDRTAVDLRLVHSTRTNRSVNWSCASASLPTLLIWPYRHCMQRN